MPPPNQLSIQNLAAQNPFLVNPLSPSGANPASEFVQRAQFQPPPNPNIAYQHPTQPALQNVQGAQGPNLGGGTFLNAPIYTPQQQQAFSNILELGGQRLAQPTEGFNPYEERARRQFQTQTIPSLAERFTAMGGGQRSSAFQSGLGQAGSDLESQLAQLRSQYGQQAEQQALQYLNLGLTPQYNQHYIPDIDVNSMVADLAAKGGSALTDFLSSVAASPASAIKDKILNALGLGAAGAATVAPKIAAGVGAGTAAPIAAGVGAGTTPNPAPITTPAKTTPALAPTGTVPGASLVPLAAGITSGAITPAVVGTLKGAGIVGSGAAPSILAGAPTAAKTTLAAATQLAANTAGAQVAAGGAGAGAGTTAAAAGGGTILSAIGAGLNTVGAIVVPATAIGIMAYGAGKIIAGMMEPEPPSSVTPQQQAAQRARFAQILKAEQKRQAEGTSNPAIRIDYAGGTYPVTTWYKNAPNTPVRSIPQSQSVANQKARFAEILAAEQMKQAGKTPPAEAPVDWSTYDPLNPNNPLVNPYVPGSLNIQPARGRISSNISPVPVNRKKRG